LTSRSSEKNSPPESPEARTIKVGGADVPYPEPTSPAVSAQMRGNRRRDTKPEVLVRSLLHRDGLRFRKDVALSVDRVRIRPDIVFSSERVAVFIDGCFWHGCPEHGRAPRANTSYWTAKLTRNVERDVRNNGLLTGAAWTVLRFWEHEPPQLVAAAIGSTVRAARKVAGGTD
jgi:DNA mismatch endonuclease (patch repair protein)